MICKTMIALGRKDFGLSQALGLIALILLQRLCVFQIMIWSKFLSRICSLKLLEGVPSMFKLIVCTTLCFINGWSSLFHVNQKSTEILLSYAVSFNCEFNTTTINLLAFFFMKPFSHSCVVIVILYITPQIYVMNK
jgi:hypothetical protein